MTHGYSAAAEHLDECTALCEYSLVDSTPLVKNRRSSRKVAGSRARSSGPRRADTSKVRKSRGKRPSRFKSSGATCQIVSGLSGRPVDRRAVCNRRSGNYWARVQCSVCVRCGCVLGPRAVVGGRILGRCPVCGVVQTGSR